MTNGEFYFSPLMASPLMEKNPILSSYPSFNSSVFIHGKFENAIYIMQYKYVTT